MISFPVPALTISVCLVVMLFTAGEGFALPPCQGSYDKTTWTNCVGSTILPEGTTPVNTGDHYQGAWINGKPEGQGVLTGKKNGNFKYIGEFKSGGAHGFGTFAGTDGYKYVGEWRNDKANGQGTITYIDGSEYVGEFRDDKAHGEGIFTYPNGKIYVGEFRDDFFNGRGTLTMTNGDIYVGEFSGDKYHGRGRYTHANGVEYFGEFRDGKLHGKGAYTYLDGSVKKGVWENNNLIESETTSGAQEHLTANPCDYSMVNKGRKAAIALNECLAEEQRLYVLKREQEKQKKIARHKEKRERIAIERRLRESQNQIEKEEQERVASLKLERARTASLKREREKTAERNRKQERIARERQERNRIWREKQEARKKDSKRIEEANENIKLALQILNFTVSGSKESREYFTVLDAENCIFQEGSSSILRVNNIFPKTVNFEKVYYTWGTAVRINFSGDAPVSDGYNSGRMTLHRPDQGFVNRVRDGWNLLFSKACKGASPSEF